MTREQYLTKKEELKQLAATIKYLKEEHKQSQRDGGNVAGWSTEKGKRHSQICGDLRKSYFSYRPGHIFMSMVRGKTRLQIESNFEAQEYGSCTNREIERVIEDLCKLYGYETDRDEYMRIISINQKVESVEKVGA